MNFRAIDELKILGHSPEDAVKLAETYQLIGMYEVKPTSDNASHAGGRVPCIGLKPEYKIMVIEIEAKKEQADMVTMPYATCFTLLKERGISPEEAHKAATMIDSIQTKTPSGMDNLERFTALYSEASPEAAFAYLSEFKTV